MHVVKQYPDGIFCWVDLSTTDTEGAKAFYSGLFGWEAVDTPTDMGSMYTMLKIDGKNVAGLGPLSPDMQAQGIPSFWTSYVKHDDVDAIAAKISGAGGMLMFPPMDVMAEGRMTMFQDPSGAVAGVWQPRNHTGAQLVNMANTLVWNELQTRDAAAAKAFYKSVFGWGDATDANGYVTYSVNGRVQAGMMQIDDSWGDVPSNWAVYFMVDDIAAATAKAVELGGVALVSEQSAGEMGQFSVIQDPQGAVFTIMQFNGPTDTPPGV
ncbi:MAG: VOC family protein [Anaerolineales bacterium]|nr:VOC family protein [Anaerolineales bacterium]